MGFFRICHADAREVCLHSGVCATQQVYPELRPCHYHFFDPDQIVPGGPKDAIDVVRPLFSALGQHAFEVGESPQAATAVKLANNFVLGCAIETMGEALALVEKLGVKPEMFFEVMTKGLFSAPAYQVYGKMIVDEAWDSIGATAVIGLKDANLALEAAEIAEAPLPSAHIWKDYLQGAIDRGEADLDWAVMAKEHARASGLEK